ncbi:hypothetical protein EAX61_13680 [Dokdonia sinensis]|uniref:DUF3857 domain-containing protein n=1 Tax=Dokdonia sinensis TaxID=2479847 RepID=A0A3M0FVF1_9FLAO|nr:hypothetical protein [Dokdonia sinensis]RMB56651.1 hypothetical protein EAX61_13680 [Dokdonia sinensis]
MKKLALLVLGILLQTTAISQVYQTKDGLTVTLKKVKNVRDKGDLKSNVKITDQDVDKIVVKCYIESNDNESVDVNSFALVDQEHKLRYRMVDFLDYRGFTSFGSENKIARKMLKEPVEIQSPYGDRIGAVYNPEVKDTFLDFEMGDYENVETKVNLGSKRNPHCSSIYYSPTKLNEFTAEFFYAVSREKTASSYDLYYKGEKLFEVGMP